MEMTKKDDFYSALLKERVSLLRYARHLHRFDEDKALDLVQDTLVKAIEYIDNFTMGTNLSGWLVTIMRHHYLTEKRKLKNKAIHFPLQDSDFLLPSKLSPFDSLNSKQELSFLKHLPIKQYRALMLSSVGFTIKQIAEKEHTQLGTIKSRISRGRDLLQKYIEGKKIMMRKHLTLDEFIALKKTNGRLVEFTESEGNYWIEWKHEFG